MASTTQEIDLTNKVFRQVLELITNTNSSVFMTGRAGTGKSTFLRYICEHTLKNYVVLAPTGIAALNAGGVTIHSFFKMPFRPVPPDDPDYSVMNILKQMKLRKEQLKVIRELDLIIIDEVSMVRADMIDYIDRALRAVTGNRRQPFGGKQLLLVGDIFQLEPVVTSEARDILHKFYPAFFFFNARAYKEIQLVSVELRKVYRQTNSEFIALLDRIRLNRAAQADLARLNARVGTLSSVGLQSEDGGEKDDFSIMLASRRDIVDSHNARMMDLNPNPAVRFMGEIQNDFPEKLLPTDMELELKVGAQVMLIKNDRERRWVNGTLARIRSIENDLIEVELENGNTHYVEREEWSNIKYTYDEKERRVKEEVVGVFRQFPLRAAWALTIHKSQGLTFNNVVIDMGGGGAFSAGQTYVALSRCRSLEGLSFVSPIQPRDIIVSREAEEFSKSFNDTMVIDRSLRESRAQTCYASSLEAFDRGDYMNAVRFMTSAMESWPGKISEKYMRLVAARLARAEKLKDTVSRQKEMLHRVADEYVELGKMSMEYPEGKLSAISNFRKAIDFNPESVTARLELAKALGSMEKFDEAATEFDELLKMKLSKKQRLAIFKSRGEMCENRKDYAGALLNYNAAIKLDKSNTALRLKISQLYARLGFDDDADDEED